MLIADRRAVPDRWQPHLDRLGPLATAIVEEFAEAHHLEDAELDDTDYCDTDLDDEFAGGGHATGDSILRTTDTGGEAEGPPGHDDHHDRHREQPGRVSHAGPLSGAAQPGSHDAPRPTGAAEEEGLPVGASPQDWFEHAQRHALQALDDLEAAWLAFDAAIDTLRPLITRAS